jgi:hypothetical protein
MTVSSSSTGIPSHGCDGFVEQFTKATAAAAAVAAAAAASGVLITPATLCTSTPASNRVASTRVRIAALKLTEAPKAKTVRIVISSQGVIVLRPLNMVGIGGWRVVFEGNRFYIMVAVC